MLVIDDDPLVHELISHWLDGAGYHAEVAVDGEIALTALGRVLPDVVVLDLSLPGMYGLEVLVRIKAMPRSPVIILTAATDVATGSSRPCATAPTTTCSSRSSRRSS